MKEGLKTFLWKISGKQKRLDKQYKQWLRHPTPEERAKYPQVTREEFLASLEPIEIPEENQASLKDKEEK